MTPPNDDVSVCTIGDSPETSTVWVSSPNFRDPSTRTVWSTSSTMRSVYNLLKPGAVIVTPYVPGGSNGTLYWPSALVMAERVSFVPKFLIVTEAPTIAAPDGSS